MKENEPGNDAKDAITGQTIIDGWPAYTSKEIPKVDPKEDELSFYVLIDVNGHRKQEDFEIGYYNFSSKGWNLKGGNPKEIDLDHMRWMYMPMVELTEK